VSYIKLKLLVDKTNELKLLVDKINALWGPILSELENITGTNP